MKRVVVLLALLVSSCLAKKSKEGDKLSPTQPQSETDAAVVTVPIASQVRMEAEIKALHKLLQDYQAKYPNPSSEREKQFMNLVDNALIPDQQDLYHLVNSDVFGNMIVEMEQLKLSKQKLRAAKSAKQATSHSSKVEENDLTGTSQQVALEGESKKDKNKQGQEEKSFYPRFGAVFLVVAGSLGVMGNLKRLKTTPLRGLAGLAFNAALLGVGATLVAEDKPSDDMQKAGGALVLAGGVAAVLSGSLLASTGGVTLLTSIPLKSDVIKKLNGEVEREFLERGGDRAVAAGFVIMGIGASEVFLRSQINSLAQEVDPIAELLNGLDEHSNKLISEYKKVYR